MPFRHPHLLQRPLELGHAVGLGEEDRAGHRPRLVGAVAGYVHHRQVGAGTPAREWPAPSRPSSPACEHQLWGSVEKARAEWSFTCHTVRATDRDTFKGDDRSGTMPELPLCVSTGLRTTSYLPRPSKSRQHLAP